MITLLCFILYPQFSIQGFLTGYAWGSYPRLVLVDRMGDTEVGRRAY
jgi:hypothetical protein